MSTARIRLGNITFVLERRHSAHGFPQVFERVVLRHELMVRDALGGAFDAVALHVVPDAQTGAPVVLVHREESPAVLRAHVHRHFVRELVVDLTGKNEKNRIHGRYRAGYSGKY